MNRHDLEIRAAAWRRHHAVRTGLSIAAAAAGAAAIAVHGSPGAAAVAAVLGGAIAAMVLGRRRRRADAAAVAAHLNRLVPELEESAGLWLREIADLAPMERLQRRRVDAAWQARLDRVRLGFPAAWTLRWPGIALLAALAALLAGMRFSVSAARSPAAAPTAAVIPVAPVLPPPELRQARMQIAPPAYTGLPERDVVGLDAEVPEGSQLVWLLEFGGDATAVRLERPGIPEVLKLAAKEAGHFAGTATVAETRIYRVAVDRRDGTAVVRPGLHAIKVVRDAAPRISWVEPTAARTTVAPGSGPVALRLTATDDYGVGAAKLVVTVAKGTGEGVKFRERELPFPRLATATAAGKTELVLALDLPALGLEPGDELYFHALVADGKTPEANVARSETRYLVLQGPAAVLTAAGAPVAGVNRLPQYFRSQRQLILDTEKLLAERPRLTEAQVRARAEEIGIDQKLLRLRYGQFLGEEFEPAALGAAPEARGAAFAARIRSPDREGGQREAAIERAIEARHNHAPAPDREGRPLTAEEIAAPFVHRHDAPESETLYEDGVKAALRAVLAAMWEAEGKLRAGDPEAALPAEQRALERLQALQQADRISVKRVGEEPAPVDLDARRLRGELDDIPARSRAAPALRPPTTGEAELRAALAAAPDWRRLPPAIRAGVEARLARAAREEPERYLAILDEWRNLGATPSGDDVARLARALAGLLPAGMPLPQRAQDPDVGRTDRYFRALENGGEGAR